MKEETIGGFIQKVRKEQGLTQKELADRINVSDKTISKWENGNSAPNTEILQDLCTALDISVNELLSGERIHPESYSKRAEENMMQLLKENEKQERNNRGNLIVGILLGILAIFLLYISAYGFSVTAIVWFFDIPSFLGEVIICAAIVLVSGAKGKLEVLKMVQKAVIPAGLFMALFSGVMIFGEVNDIETIGPNLAIAVLSVFYSLLAYLILLAIVKRLENKKNSSIK